MNCKMTMLGAALSVTLTGMADCSACASTPTPSATCANDDNCLDGYVCDTATGKCVHEDAGAGTPDAASDAAGTDATPTDRVGTDQLHRDSTGTDTSGVDQAGRDTGAADRSVADGATPDRAFDAGPARCGNGRVEGSEACDDGNGILSDACPDGPHGTCLTATCGDGFVFVTAFGGTEQCDDATSACSACQLLASCGNGQPDLGEACDLGTGNSNTAAGDCPTVCRRNCQCPACGDGVTDFARGEQCDDLNTSAGDGCSATCAIEPIASCGDGVLDIAAGEECDDDNLTAGDGCSGVCQLEPVGAQCPDNTVQAPEKCDDNNRLNGDGCNPTCNLTTTLSTLISGLSGSALAVDGDSIWIGSGTSGASPCAIARIDLRGCLGGGGCTARVVAGGVCGAISDGVGTGAVLGSVEAMASDGSTLWFGSSHTIRAMDISTTVVHTLTGDPALCGTLDGVGSAAVLHDVRGLAYDGGYVYFLDGCDQLLRRFDPVTRSVVTLAGVPTTSSAPFTCPATWSCNDGTVADGFGPVAAFGSPRYMTADRSGNLYIVDTNGESLRSYNIATGYVGTLIGGAGYQDGVGVAARIQRPRGIASDGTSIYWKEQTAHTVRQLEIQGLTASTLIGVRGCPGTRDGVGGDGTQNWSQAGGGGCRNSAVDTLPKIDTPLGDIVFDFASRSLLLTESGRLRRVD